jgi:hypothetical protein
VEVLEQGGIDARRLRGRGDADQQGREKELGSKAQWRAPAETRLAG